MQQPATHRRPCPECGEPGVIRDEVYPDGCPCLYCRKHIEVDTTFIVLFVAALIVLMLLDFRVWGTGLVGVPCAVLLIAIGLKLKPVYSRFMPLRHYPDTDAGTAN